MTDDKIALRALLEKSSDASMLREMISFAAERLMALETETLCGAAPGERSAERINQRNGYPRPGLAYPGRNRRAAYPKASARQLLSWLS